MTRVTIIGGSGYAGSHIAEAAAVRGFTVTSVTRGEVAQQIAGVTYTRGSILDPADRARWIAGSDVIIVAISPRGDMAGETRRAIAELAAEVAAASGVRLGVVGGAGSLLQAPGGPRVMDGPEFPAEIQTEAAVMGDVLEDLRATPEQLDWFYVSPAGGFGPWAAGEYTGEYRLGGDVLLTDAEGNSNISGADFGVAVVDEIETPEHRRQRFTLAY
ncbi:Rrf2-linked NADH-flavin reductase [Leucobacter sp. 7(1)]|uniref:NAD(P)-dependent oxidoreductase n=1 Tax=Leucobacter sp. 7(1) TaxID=1255613 RepID=UPI00097ED62B|nr:NAD(P)H-binding protein [Leucobacter sp. 7(1)]SJN13109.1 Rrf2-linked NADH-flavin reductase [Leucobacter sp. 7(1)]